MSARPESSTPWAVRLPAPATPGLSDSHALACVSALGGRHPAPLLRTARPLRRARRAIPLLARVLGAHHRVPVLTVHLSWTFGAVARLDRTRRVEGDSALRHRALDLRSQRSLRRVGRAERAPELRADKRAHVVAVESDLTAGGGDIGVGGQGRSCQCGGATHRPVERSLVCKPRRRVV